MPHPRAAAVLAALLAAAPAAPRAQEAAAAGGDELSLFALDAELARETTVASRRARTVRETPGIVTVIDREELLASGARDLADVLARVPGFQLGGDIQSTLGPGFRGIWGNEGKILVLLDGFELNDLSYGNVPLGNHFHVEQLERVEIIRGPGSAMYGGHAELAVVNLVSRAAAVTGAEVSATGARGTGSADATGAVTAAYLAGAAGTRAAGLELGATGAFGAGLRGNGTYRDLSGASYAMSEASDLSPGQVTARLAWGGLEVRGLYDDYRTTSRDGYGDVGPVARTRWRTAATDARFTWRPSERVTVTPQVTWRWERPWQETDPSLADLYYDVTNQRLTGRLLATWDPTAAVGLVAGAEAYVERGQVNPAARGVLSYQGQDSVTYRNVAGFAEVSADTPVVNLVAGARVEHHDAFGTSFVPRLALTRMFSAVHVKLLASGAFRAPSIENINYGQGVRPERTRAFEAEVGWQLWGGLYAVVNAFDLVVDNPIVFGFSGTDVYTNEARTGSRGVETVLEWRRGPVLTRASWSFYDARGVNEAQPYVVPGHPEVLLGMAGHKVVADAQLRVARDVVVAPALLFLSDRWGYDRLDAGGQPAVGRIGARVTADLYVTWQNAGVRGLELAAGVRDAFDQGTVYVQPYPGGHAPTPGVGRELSVRVRWEPPAGR